MKRVKLNAIELDSKVPGRFRRSLIEVIYREIHLISVISVPQR